MTRDQFEHALRAAADIVDDELVVIGSQAILGQFPEAPPELVVSNEVDAFPVNRPERADDIDGSIGDGSRFYETFGYYVHGVGPETVRAPAGWENRLIRVQFPARGRSRREVRVRCLEVHDLVLSNLAVGRPHDTAFAIGAVRHDLANAEQLALGVDLMPEEYRESVRERLEGVLAQVGRNDGLPNA